MIIILLTFKCFVLKRTKQAVTLKTSPPLILPLSSICYSMQEMEDSFLSDVVTEPGAYSIPPGNSEDSLLTLPFTSMVQFDNFRQIILSLLIIMWVLCCVYIGIE